MNLFQNKYEKILELPDENQSVIQRFYLPDIDENLQTFVVRDDLIHQAISGNKWRKLKYNLEKAKNENFKTILTFGGAFSNHLFAVATAGKIYDFETIAFVRGEEYEHLNPTLEYAKLSGMSIYYINRETYRNRNNPNFQQELAKNFKKPFIVPEGGSNHFALKGVAEIYKLIPFTPNYVFSAVGSGGTLAGLIDGAEKSTKIIGITAIKNGSYMKEIIKNFISYNSENEKKFWSLFTDFHFGGFAKIDRKLVDFANKFQQINGFEIDFIYTAKMFYAIWELAKQNYFCKTDKIVAIHTGGLQGNVGMQNKINKIINYGL